MFKVIVVNSQDVISTSGLIENKTDAFAGTGLWTTPEKMTEEQFWL